MIDLHVHSTFSDGSFSPEELVEMAVQSGLSALALTDHDTTDGVPRLLSASEASGIVGVGGVEISAEFAGGTMHLLGLDVNPAESALQEALARIRMGRGERNQQIVTHLNELGLALPWERVEPLANGGVVGRPHIAQAMVECGLVSSREKAFSRFLRRGGPAYAERFRLSPEEGIGRIRGAGGVPVLAHPFTLGLRFRKLRECVRELSAMGLQGIEVFYPEHGQERRAQYTELAKEFDLVMTGGSDFHGAANPAIHLGRGFGNVCVSDGILVALRDRVQRGDSS